MGTGGRPYPTHHQLFLFSKGADDNWVPFSLLFLPLLSTSLPTSFFFLKGISEWAPSASVSAGAEGDKLTSLGKKVEKDVQRRRVKKKFQITQ